MIIEYVFYSRNYSTQLDRDDSLNHNINITADPSPMEVRCKQRRAWRKDFISFTGY